MKALVAVCVIGALASGVWVVVSLLEGSWAIAGLAVILAVGLAAFGGSVKL